MNRRLLIEKAKAYAASNYENGMDTFVECYGEAEWSAFFDGAEYGAEITTWAAAKSLMDALAEVYRERQAIARSYADNE